MESVSDCIDQYFQDSIHKNKNQIPILTIISDNLQTIKYNITRMERSTR